MTRIGGFLALLIAIGACFGLYALKYQVEELESRRADLNRTLAANEEAIRVSRAEWHYLNTPERLQELTSKYLPLTSTPSSQIGSIDDLPLRSTAEPLAARGNAAYSLLKPHIRLATQAVEEPGFDSPEAAAVAKVSAVGRGIE